MRGGGGVSQMLTIADGGGVQEPLILADVICEQPLTSKFSRQLAPYKFVGKSCISTNFLCLDLHLSARILIRICKIPLPLTTTFTK